MLFVGPSLDEARAVFADYARRHPAALLTIRQRSRVLDQWPRDEHPPRRALTSERSARPAQQVLPGRRQLIGAREDHSALMNSPFNNRRIKFSVTERTSDHRQQERPAVPCPQSGEIP